MNLPRFSVRRPVLTVMITLIVMVVGVVSLTRLRMDLLPAIELPTVSVRTDYEGASPEVVERLITEVVEEVVGTVPGVEELSSTSEEGRSNVNARFGWDVNADVAAMDVQARMEAELNELPEDVTRPNIHKFDPNSFPVVVLGVSSKLDPIELTSLVDEQIRYRFARLTGVAQVDPWGGYDREVRVELLPERIKALGVPLNTVLDAIRNANLDLPAGTIERGKYETTLRAPAEFQSVDEISDTVVAVRDGAPVTLGQIAHVRDTYSRLSRYIRVDGDLGLRLAIRKASDANTVEVSRAVLETIDEVNREFPQLHIVAVSNEGGFIERSISNVAQSVLYGGGLAVLVLLFFLRNVRSTFVISLAIPISIIATFALMFLGGLTLNLMTLGGLALGVGMMVDSAIVVLENIFRRRDELHEAPAEAAERGGVEVGPAIVASTITTLVIFLPVLFIRGVSGTLFTALALVIVFALSASLVVSLSLVPMLAAKLIKPKPPAGSVVREGWLTRLGNRTGRALDGLESSYLRLLRSAVNHRWITVAATSAVFFASLWLLPWIGSEFLPPSDEGQVSVTGEMEIGTRIDVVDRQTRRMEKIVFDAVPEATSSVVSVRGGEGGIDLSLVPASQRQRSNTQIAEDLRKRLVGKVPGMDIRTRAPQGQQILNRLLGSGDESLAIEVRGYDLDTLDALTKRVQSAITDIDGISDVVMPRNAGNPLEQLTVDRQKAADLGLSVRDIAEVIETAVAGRQAGAYRRAGNSYPILVQFADAQRLSVDDVLQITLRTPTGQDVSLRNLVSTEPGLGPVQINRKDQQRLLTVKANVAGRDLGSVAADVSNALAAIPRPVGYELHIAGSYEEQQKAFGELLVGMVMALLLVYMVLASQYESLRDPLVVMMSVPTAATGVLITLFLTHTTLNLQSYIGCIMLGGIVVNNAILLVDQAGQLRVHEGFAVHDAVIEAGRRRLRPILMTTLTTVFGLLPLALGIGEGADAQSPLARAVIGGLVGSTLVTLVLIPAVYTLFHPEPADHSATQPTAGALDASVAPPARPSWEAAS